MAFLSVSRTETSDGQTVCSFADDSKQIGILKILKLFFLSMSFSLKASTSCPKILLLFTIVMNDSAAINQMLVIINPRDAPNLDVFDVNYF